MANASKNVLSEVLSFFDPELQALAIKLAKAIPEGSIIRTRLFARVFGPFKAWAEQSSEDLNPIIGALLEKFVDFGDAFSTILVEGEAKAAPADRSKGVTGEEWIKSLLKDAEKRIHEAVNEEAARAEAKKIELEFELRLSLIEYIKKKLSEEEPKTTPGPAEASLAEELQKIRASFLARKAAFAQKIRTVTKQITPHIKNLADRLEQERLARETRKQPAPHIRVRVRRLERQQLAPEIRPILTYPPEGGLR